jgi:hypothetical protein
MFQHAAKYSLTQVWTQRAEKTKSPLSRERGIAGAIVDEDAKLHGHGFEHVSLISI